MEKWRLSALCLSLLLPLWGGNPSGQGLLHTGAQPAWGQGTAPPSAGQAEGTSFLW